MRNFMRPETPMLFFFACVIATQVSCSSDTTTNPGPPVAAVTVALNANLLSVGHTAQASAAVKDSAGNAINGQTISWASQDTGVAKVSSEGAVTAVAAGSTVIQGKISGKIGGALLTFGLIAGVGGIAISAIVWALGSHSANPHLAGRGKVGVVVAAVCALLLGGADVIIAFFQQAGAAI